MTPSNKAFFFYKAGAWGNINYKVYYEKADYLSRIFIEKGISKGDHVMSISQNRPEWNILDRALAQIGAVHVSLFPTFSKENLSHILASIKPKFIFVSGLMLEKTLSTLLIEKADIDKVYNFGNKGDRGFDALMAEETKTTKEQLSQVKEQIDENDILSLIYTSGTSAMPKGIAHSHGDLFKYAEIHKDIYNLSSGDIALSFLPLCHGYERTHNYYCQMVEVPVYYASSQDDVLSLLQQTKATFITVVPVILESLYKLVNEKGGVDVLKSTTNLKIVASSGASLPEYLLSFLEEADIKVVESYGLTECLGVTSNYTNNSKANSVGKALPYVKLKISDEEEILVNSPTGLKYALVDDQKKQPELIDNKWYATGDSGFIDREGFLFITGRKKDRFKTNAGRYISPVEIENELKQNDIIEQALVVGFNKPYIAAIVVVNNPNGGELKGKPIKIEEELDSIGQSVVNYNKGKLPSERIEKYIAIKDEWTVEGGELTHSKKVRRNFLEKKYAGFIEELYTST